MKESDVVRQMLKTLNSIDGVFAFRTHGSAFQMRGTPDIIGCFHGKFFAIEAKRTAKGRASPVQEYILEQIRQAGGYAVVSSDMTCGEVITWGQRLISSKGYGNTPE